MRPIIKGRNIRKSYGQKGAKTEVLKGVELELAPGEFVTIMGKSGSGKSTLLNVLSTLDTCEEGEIYFKERPVTGLKEEESARLRRESFGFVFQMPRMVKNLDILDNILLPSLEYPKDREGTKRKALDLMEEIGIRNLARKRIFEVSGGQLQRAGICRALINNPALLFADEPTGALDSKTGEEVLRLFLRFHREGRSILVVTHDAGVAARSQRVLFMKDGILAGEYRPGEAWEEETGRIQAEMAAL